MNFHQGISFFCFAFLMLNVHFCESAVLDPDYFCMYPIETWNKTTEFCCNGVIHDLIPGAENSTACCRGEVYNSAGQVCCGSFERNPGPSTLMGFNSWQRMSYTVMNKQSADHNQCCHGVSYNDATTGCCGTDTFDLSTEYCCINTRMYLGLEEIRPKVGNDSCCLTNGMDSIKATHYNSSTQICCSGKVMDKMLGSSSACCFDVIYDSDTEVCCNSQQIYPKNNPNDNSCCLIGNQYWLYDNTTSSCCRENNVQNPIISNTKSMCCNQKIVDNKYGNASSCCWGVDEVIDSNTQMCCNRNVYNKTYGEDSRCCNNYLASPAPSHVYNESAEICCSGKIFNKSENTECCYRSSTAFNNITQMCCPSGLINKTSADDDGCCGNSFRTGSYLTYNTNNQVCCDNSLYNKNTTICCDGKYPRSHDGSATSCCVSRSFYPPQYTVYNENTHICCENANTITGTCGESTGNIRLRDFGNDTTCCGSSTINGSSHVCCSEYNGTSREKLIPGDNMCCGNNATYNRFFEKCCSDSVVPTPLTGFYVPPFYCCGSSIYHSSSQSCCYGEYPTDHADNKDHYLQSCCGQYPNIKTFNYRSALCCNDSVLDMNKTKANACCGNSTFNYTTEICCGRKNESINVVIKKTTENHYACCGNPEVGLQSYNPSTHICCNNMLFTSNVNYPPACCNNTKLFSRETQICCGGDVYNKPNFGKSNKIACCEADGNSASIFHPRSEMCCNGSVYNYSDDKRCCSFYSNGKNMTAAYETETEICCGNEFGVIPLAKPYHNSCCGNTSYMRTLEECCNNVVITTALEICCSGEVFPRGVNDSCCPGCAVNTETVDKTFNSHEQICCDGNVFARGINDSCCGRTPYNSTIFM